MEKKVHITFDYELFFGEKTGTVENCMIKPTARLLEIAGKRNAKLVFFIDAGYLVALTRNLNHEKCAQDFDKVAAQVKLISELGHEIGLHVHPHWEDCLFDEGEWKVNTSRYKLSDFSEEDVLRIVTSYHDVLKQITGKPCKSYRAGGWCVQPFTNIKSALEQNQIYTDSSVYQNGFHQFSAHTYDFRKAPNLTEWTFSNNVCEPDESGVFSEVAITPDKISPAFYFSLYAKMRTNPALFKPYGDGMWLKDKSKIRKQFYSSTNHFACCDGYFASRMVKILNRVEREQKKRMLILGHPKSLAECSFQYLDSFIEYALQKKFNVTTIC